MQDYTTAKGGIVRRNAAKTQRRAQGETVEADEVMPPVPTLPDDYDPFTPDQREIIAAYTEAFKFHQYSRALQYTLTKVMKGKPHRFVLQCNHNNASGFETWRRMHVTYDQVEKAQQLNLLWTIMKPTRNNISQAPGESIRQFQKWRDEIYNIENTESTTKEKERSRRAEKITATTTQAKEKAIRVTTRTTRKANQKENAHHDPTTSKGKEKATKATQATTVTTVDRKEVPTAEDEAEEKDQKANNPATTFHQYHHRTRAKVQHYQKEKEKGTTLFATSVAGQDTQATNVGGKDKHTTLINHHQFGQYPTTANRNNCNNCLHNPQPLQQ
eukprot:4696022-Amphidinium_carterae.2